MMEGKFAKALKAFAAQFFTFNIFWRFICEVINVIMIMLSSYFMMVCLAHGLGRTHEYHFLLIAAVYSWIFFSIIKLQKRKLGKTKLKR